MVEHQFTREEYRCTEFNKYKLDDKKSSRLKLAFMYIVTESYNHDLKQVSCRVTDQWGHIVSGMEEEQVIKRFKEEMNVFNGG
jgi:hypothetical protein